MMLAGAGAAPAGPGALGPPGGGAPRAGGGARGRGGVVPPRGGRVGRARGGADPERRPRGGPAAGSLRRSWDRAIGVAVDVGSTVGTPFPLGRPPTGPSNGCPAQRALRAPPRRLCSGWSDCEALDVRDESRPWSRIDRVLFPPGDCVIPQSPCK